MAGIIVGGFRRSFRINMSDPIASLTRREWWVWICSLVVIVMAIPLLGGNDHLSGNDDADGYSFMMSMVLSVGRKENGKSPFRL